MEGTRRMLAVALDRFGGPEELRVRELPVPEVGDDEVLVQVHAAGVGEWDPFERSGGYAQMLGLDATFPYVLGSEGAGVLAAVGRNVTRFRVGDSVYGLGFLNPKGGFYAQFAALPAALVAPIPAGVSFEEAAAMGGVGITALRGLEQVLGLQRGESLLVFGASGGVGHLALQLAKRRGARVLAAASGPDGVALAAALGADAVVDGRRDDLFGAARAFAPDGLDAVLATASGEALDHALSHVRSGGRVAFPNGVQPEPKASSTVQVTGYNGEPDATIIASFQREIQERPLRVHLGGRFSLEKAADAHRALDRHYLGKLVLEVPPVRTP